MLRALLLDFNGVLVDDEPIHLDLLAAVCREEGLEVASDLFEELAGLDDRSAFTQLLAAAGEESSTQRVFQLVARKARLYQEVVRRQGFQFFAGALELVEGAAEQGLMLGVVSGALREEIVQALHQAGLRRTFKVIVTSEDVLRGKPDPEIYRRAVELFNLEPPLPERLLHPHEVLAIEDSPTGIEAAQRAGLVTLGVGHTYPIERLDGAHRVVERLTELSPRELQQVFSEASRR